MPYVALSNLQNGVEPSWRMIAAPEDARAEAGEVLADDSEAPPRAGYVWDAASQRLRARTTSESLDHAKALKRREIKAAADAEYIEKVSMFDGDIVAGKWGRQVALNAYETSALSTMQDIYSRLRQKIQAVNAASTVSEVEGVTWTP